MMEKLDLTKKYKTYYSAKTKPEMLAFGETYYLSIEGKGDPSGQDFADRIQALYTTAYVLKFIYKGLGKDFAVAKLEGLWWFDESQFKKVSITEAPLQIPRDQWYYRLLIRIPEYITPGHIELAVRQAQDKKGIALAAEVKCFKLHEGKSVQMLHIGPFNKEPETLLVMQDFMTHMSLQRNGLHHEIYLSDFRKTTPEKLKTILREPVK